MPDEAEEESGGEVDELTDKEAYDCISDGLNGIAALWAMGAAAFGGLGAIPLAAGAGIVSGAAWFGSYYVGELAEDPPRKDFHKFVSIPKTKKVTLKLGKGRPVESFKRMTSALLRFNDLAQVSLTTLERLNGALEAGKRPMAVKQGWLLRDLHAEGELKYHELTRETLAFASRIEGTPLNVKIVKSDVVKFVHEVKAKGLPAAWKRGMRDAGMTTWQMQRFVDWLTHYDFSGLKEAKLSWHLRKAYFSLREGQEKMVLKV